MVSIPSVSVSYARNGNSTRANELGMRSLREDGWRLIREGRTLPDIRDTIVGEYDVTPECCERDLAQLLSELASQGLISVGATAAA